MMKGKDKIMFLDEGHTNVYQSILKKLEKLDNDLFDFAQLIMIVLVLILYYVNKQVWLVFADGVLFMLYFINKLVFRKWKKKQ